MKEPRWVLVVRGHRQDIYESLRQSLEAQAPIEVLFERRRKDRRRDGAAVSDNRRRRDRRQRPAVAMLFESDLAAAEGARASAAALPDPQSPMSSLSPRPSANGMMRKICPDCGSVYEFDMPQFPTPPARLVAELVHARFSASNAQHFGEVHAYAASGRFLLAEKVRARRVWQRTRL